MMLSRRQFAKTTALALGAAALPLRGLPSHAKGRARPRTFTPIRRNVGTFEGQGGTIGWLIAPDALAVVDTQFPDSATTCWSGVRERSERRIDFLINSHHHGDHTAGNPVFAPHADEVLAHRNVPRLQRAAAERSGSVNSQIYAELLYDEEWRGDVGDETIHLKYYGSAHTSGDSVIHFVNADVVHMGDLVFNHRPMFLDVGAGGTSEGWIDVLERVHADFSDETVFIYGHANPSYGITGTREDLLSFRDYLTALREHIGAGIAAGKSVDELLVGQLPMFEEYNNADQPEGLHRNIRDVYGELSGAPN